MDTRELTGTLTTLLDELLNGPAASASYMLNAGDSGLLRSLDGLSAAAASAASTGSAPVAAHVDHLRYALSLLNRWSAGAQPFDDADWSASWRIARVSDAEWQELRRQLRGEAQGWLETLRVPREVSKAELDDIVGSIAHVAYHLGAIRQISAAARGPAARERH